MKITNVRTTLLTGPATDDPFTAECRHRRSAAFIEVDTNLGVSGLGETYAGYFFPELVPETVKFFAPILIGRNVDDIPNLWRQMYHCGNFWCRVGWGASVLAGIEAALWDLKGKIEKVPVHRLLGGSRHSALPCYASGGPSNYPKDQLARKIDFYTSLGFKSVKLGTGSYNPEELWEIKDTPDAAAEYEVDKLQFVRSRFGSDLEVMLDGHMGNSPARRGRFQRQRPSWPRWRHTDFRSSRSRFTTRISRATRSFAAPARSPSPAVNASPRPVNGRPLPIMIVLTSLSPTPHSWGSRNSWKRLQSLSGETGKLPLTARAQRRTYAEHSLRIRV